MSIVQYRGSEGTIDNIRAVIVDSNVTPNKKASRAKSHEALIDMVRLAGFEPATYGLEVRCSIQLSYRRIFDRAKPYYHTIRLMSIPKNEEKS